MDGVNMKLSRSSLLYRVATKYGGADDYYPSMDFCELFWGLARGTILLFLITCLGIGIGWFLFAIPIVSLLIGINLGWHHVSIRSDLSISLLLWLCVFVAGFIIYLCEGHMKDDFENSFIYNAYIKFKHKYCAFIDITP